MSNFYRLLLVEDDPVLSKLLVGVLGIEHTVESASLLSDAKILLSANVYDAVILDKSLPDGSGETILKDIKSGDRSTCVLMLSGDSDFGSIRRCLSAGADDYLIKGDSLIPDLLVRLAVALDSRRKTVSKLPVQLSDLSPEHYRAYMNAFQKSYFESALQLVNYKVSDLAIALGVSRATIFNRIQELGINRVQLRESLVEHEAPNA